MLIDEYMKKERKRPVCQFKQELITEDVSKHIAKAENSSGCEDVEWFRRQYFMKMLNASEGNGQVVICRLLWDLRQYVEPPCTVTGTAPGLCLVLLMHGRPSGPRRTAQGHGNPTRTICCWCTFTVKICILYIRSQHGDINLDWLNQLAIRSD